MNSNKLMKTLNVHDILLGLICVLSLVLLWKTVNKPESFNTNDSNTIDSQRALDYRVDTNNLYPMVVWQVPMNQFVLLKFSASKFNFI